MSTITVHNPITGEPLYDVQETPEEQIQQTFERAREAFLKVRGLSVKERLKFIKRMKQYIVAHQERIMDRIIAETGKSRMDALVSEIFSVLDHLEYLEKRAEDILKEKKVETPLALMGKKSYIYHDPLGIILVISPWNYPFYLAIVPITSAFVAGNAVIFKPSEHTPLRGLIEEIVSECDFPENAIQVVYGTGVTGSRLIDHRPNKIFFTGSVRTGKKIMEQASNYLIPVELELGGKDAMIVFDDVNLERTVAGAIWGAITNCGQSCTSVERLYVHENIHDEFVALLKQRLQDLVIGEGTSPDVDVGSMTPEFQVRIVEEHLRDAEAKGAKVTKLGRQLKDGKLFLPIMVVENVNDSMKIWTEETFGPIIPVTKFKTEDEVIQAVNSSPYGLSASVWSKDLERARRVARLLEVGNVSINNVMLTEGNPALPFGGVKESGFGRIKGEVGLLGFTNIKSVIIDKQSNKLEPNWYPYTKRKYELFKQLMTALFASRGIMRLLKAALVGLKLERESQKKR